MRQVSGSGLLHSSAMQGTIERSLKLMFTSPSNTLYITRLPWISVRMTGLRLPNSPPHTPTRSSRSPCAIAGARPVPSSSPAPNAPAPRPQRVIPCPPVVRMILPIAASNSSEPSVVFLQSILDDLVKHRDQAGLQFVGRAVDVGDE